MIAQRTAALFIAVFCASAATGAALPDDYLSSIALPTEPLTEAAGHSDTEQAARGLPSMFDFPLVRIIDANGDRSPDLLLLGDDIRIVLVHTETSNATLPCGNAGPGGELRDCGEGNGAAFPGVCSGRLSSTITSATRSALQVDNLM